MWTLEHSGTEQSFATWGFSSDPVRERYNQREDSLTLSARQRRCRLSSGESRRAHRCMKSRHCPRGG